MINVELPDSLKKLNILSLNVKIFKCFGLLVDYSQVTNRWKAAFFLFLQALTIFLHAQHLICTSIEMYILRNSPNDIGYGFIFAIAHAKNVLKLGVLIVYRTKYIRLFKSLDNNYLIQGKPPTDVELASLANYFQLTMRLGKYIWTSFVLTALSICFNTPPRPNLDKMLNSTSGDQMTIRRDSGMKEWFPVRGVESPYFELTTAYELLTMAVYFVCVNLMNVTFLALIIYATAQFSLLADSLKNATTNVADTFKDRGGNSVSKKKLDSDDNSSGELEETANTQLHCRITSKCVDSGSSPGSAAIGTSAVQFHVQMLLYLNKCIKHHQRLLAFSKQLNEAVAPVMFMQMLCTAVLLAFIGVLLSSASESAEYVRAVSFLCYVLMEFGLICWISAELQAQSERVGTAALLCEFYEEPVKFQKSVSLIVMRSQRPVRLSAGPFGSLSLELFGTVLNSAYSYFTILREVARE